MAQFVTNFVEPSDPEYAPPVQKGETPVRCLPLVVYIFWMLYIIRIIIFCQIDIIFSHGWLNIFL